MLERKREEKDIEQEKTEFKSSLKSKRDTYVKYVAEVHQPSVSFKKQKEM